MLRDSKRVDPWSFRTLDDDFVAGWFMVLVLNAPLLNG